MIDLMLTHRQTGRTTELMRWLREGENRVLFVHSMQEAERIMKEVRRWYADRDMGCPIQDWQITTPDRKPIGKNVSEAAIDNLELHLHYLTGYAPAKIITADTMAFNLVENV